MCRRSLNVCLEEELTLAKAGQSERVREKERERERARELTLEQPHCLLALLPNVLLSASKAKLHLLTRLGEYYAFDAPLWVFVTLYRQLGEFSSVQGGVICFRSEQLSWVSLAIASSQRAQVPSSSFAFRCQDACDVAEGHRWDIGQKKGQKPSE